uniref:LORF2-like protein n=2 Tax=anatid alphaherpesvirus 1 TaxID=104388 RepID=C4PEF5_9ALPH|nr:LORF2-like protein [Anatid alphaherpesvirus 1]
MVRPEHVSMLSSSAKKRRATRQEVPLGCKIFFGIVVLIIIAIIFGLFLVLDRIIGHGPESTDERQSQLQGKEPTTVAPIRQYASSEQQPITTITSMANMKTEDPKVKESKRKQTRTVTAKQRPRVVGDGESLKATQHKVSTLQNQYMPEAAGSATLHYWNITTETYINYTIGPDIYNTLITDGVLGPGRDIILLTHGWTGVKFADNVFMSFLRFHQRMTPTLTVLFINWTTESRNRSSFDDRIADAMIDELSFLFLNLDVEQTKLHCIGHSIGGYLCSAICRDFSSTTGAKCKRLVAIDPSTELTIQQIQSRVTSSKINTISKQDAEYVVVFASNQDFFRPGKLLTGHEYIVAKLGGPRGRKCDAATRKWNRRICGTNFFNERFCETLTHEEILRRLGPPTESLLCSQFVGPAQYMKLLDVEQSLVTLQPDDRSPEGQYGLVYSVWNAYVSGLDYRYISYYGYRPEWYIYEMHSTDITTSNLVVVMATSGSIINVMYSTGVYSYTLGSFSVAAALMHGSYDTKKPLFISCSGGRILSVHLSGGRGYLREYQNGTFIHKLPMTTRKLSLYNCHEFGKHAGSIFKCESAGTEHYIPIYRSQLTVTKTIPVPPLQGCLQYDDLSNITLTTVRPPVSTQVNSSVTIYPGHHGQVMQIEMVNTVTGQTDTILTFWDICNISRDRGIVMAFDRTTPMLRLLFRNSGNYTIYLKADFGTTEANVTVLDKPIR